MKTKRQKKDNTLKKTTKKNKNKASVQDLAMVHLKTLLKVF
jgi:hypothetical protein